MFFTGHEMRGLGDPVYSNLRLSSPLTKHQVPKFPTLNCLPQEAFKSLSTCKLPASVTIHTGQEEKGVQEGADIGNSKAIWKSLYPKVMPI